jgi:diamine N-acetyltransferase
MLNSILENDNIFLRAVEPEDAEIIYKWENNTQNWQVSNTLAPFSMHTIKQYALNSSHDISKISNFD